MILFTFEAEPQLIEKSLPPNTSYPKEGIFRVQFAYSRWIFYI